MTGRVILVIYTWLATDFCPFHRLCRYFGFAWETSIHAVCYVVVYYALYTVSLLYSVLYEKSYIVALVLVLCLNAWMPNALHTGPIAQSGSAYNLVGLFAAPGSKKKKKWSNSSLLNSQYSLSKFFVLQGKSKSNTINACIVTTVSVNKCKSKFFRIIDEES